MDDWLREGLNDIASEAPGGLEVPTTLKRRARRRMTLTVLVSLVMVSFLTVAAVAGVGAIRNAPVPGDSPSPSVEPPEQDPNHVTLRLTESGCTLESSGGVADPALLRVQVVNETDDRVFIDIGRLDDNHTVAELAEHVRDVASRPVQSLDVVNPPFFRRHVYGRSVETGSGHISTLPDVGDTPAVWQPARKARAGTYAMVCYHGSLQAGSLVPVGVVGLELAQRRDETEPDPNYVTVRLTESGCTLESSGKVFDPALLRVQVVNETDDRVFIDIGRLVGDHTVADLAEDVRDRRQPLKEPKFFRRYIYGDSGAGNAITALPSFGDITEWQFGPRARGGTYAMVCYLGSFPTGPLVPVGVVGPVELKSSSSGP